jgi:hypothetical protein
MIRRDPAPVFRAARPASQDPSLTLAATLLLGKNEGLNAGWPRPGDSLDEVLAEHHRDLPLNSLVGGRWMITLMAGVPMPQVG